MRAHLPAFSQSFQNIILLNRLFLSALSGFREGKPDGKTGSARARTRISLPQCRKSKAAEHIEKPDGSRAEKLRKKSARDDCGVFPPGQNEISSRADIIFSKRHRVVAFFREEKKRRFFFSGGKPRNRFSEKLSAPFCRKVLSNGEKPAETRETAETRKGGPRRNAGGKRISFKEKAFAGF